MRGRDGVPHSAIGPLRCKLVRSQEPPAVSMRSRRRAISASSASRTGRVGVEHFLEPAVVDLEQERWREGRHGGGPGSSSSSAISPKKLRPLPVSMTTPPRLTSTVPATRMLK